MKEAREREREREREKGEKYNFPNNITQQTNKNPNLFLSLFEDKKKRKSNNNNYNFVIFFLRNNHKIINIPSKHKSYLLINIYLFNLIKLTLKKKEIIINLTPT